MKLKHILILILILLLFTSCNSTISNDIPSNDIKYGINIQIRGGCEYVTARVRDNINIIHHAACTNPLHYSNCDNYIIE